MDALRKKNVYRRERAIKGEELEKNQEKAEVESQKSKE